MSAASNAILMVEDSPTQALLLQNLLERNGFAATLARGGRQALEALEHERPFMVITDIQMPEMDGYTLCRHIKENPAHGQIPVMLLTSLSSPADIIQGLECGADNFVAKPYDPDFLISRIRAMQAETPADGDEPEGVALAFGGKEYLIHSGRRQILNLLLSTYEAVIHTNRELVSAHDSLKAAQAQLIEAEKLQSVGRLASGVAHEIRNPLAIIEMAAALLADHAREEDLPVIAEVREAVRRASVVITKLVDLSVPKQTALGQIEITEAVDAALAPFADALEAAHIAVRREDDGVSCRARLDAARIDQAFGNIIANARDAMAARAGSGSGGELLISIRVQRIGAAEATYDPGDRSGDRLRVGDRVVAVRFSDTGPGFTPEQLARAFDPFFSSKPAGKGVGLGLTVARKVVELHGGRILLQNRPGGGAEVTVLLRCPEEDAP